MTNRNKDKNSRLVMFNVGARVVSTELGGEEIFGTICDIHGHLGAKGFVMDCYDVQWDDVPSLRRHKGEELTLIYGC